MSRVYRSSSCGATAANDSRSAAARAAFCSRARERLVVCEPRDRRGAQLGLVVQAGRSGDRRSPQPAPRAAPARRPRSRARRSRLGAKSAAREAPSRAVRTRDAARQVARDRRPRDERRRPQQHRLPARQLAQRTEDLPRHRPLVRPQLDDDALPLRRGRMEVERDAGRDEVVVAGEALVCRLAHRLGEREQCVDACQQLLALRAGGRVAEPVGRAEGGDRERVGLPQRQVGERGQAGLEAVDEVEPAAREREPEVRAHADGNAHLRAPRDRHRRADRHHVLRRRVPVHDAPAGEERGCARRGREDRDLVAERPETVGNARDVLVHVMRLRPRERRDETDAHGSAAYRGQPRSDGTSSRRAARRRARREPPPEITAAPPSGPKPAQESTVFPVQEASSDDAPCRTNRPSSRQTLQR